MSEHEAEGSAPIHLPPPTPWPMVLGVGMAMMMAGVIVFLRQLHLADGRPSLGVPLLGAALFFLALINMLRNDVREGAGHGHG